jgi:hypothetical protein
VHASVCASKRARDCRFHAYKWRIIGDENIKITRTSNCGLPIRSDGAGSFNLIKLRSLKQAARTMEIKLPKQLTNNFDLKIGFQ